MSLKNPTSAQIEEARRKQKHLTIIVAELTNLPQDDFLKIVELAILDRLALSSSEKDRLPILNSIRHLDRAAWSYIPLAWEYRDERALPPCVGISEKKEERK